MKFNTIVFIIFSISVIKAQEDLTPPAPEETDDEKVERIVDSEVIIPDEDSLPLVDLQLEVLNNYYAQLTEVGQKYKYQPESLGESYVTFAKVADHAMSLSVFYADPNDAEGGVKKAYHANYRWIQKFKTLVAVECRHIPLTPIDPPKIDHYCEYGVELAANVMKVAVAANVRDIEEAGYEKLAECIKEKTIKYESTTFHNCFLSTVEDNSLARASMQDKIRQLKAEGYECDDQGRCTLKTDYTTKEETTEIESQEVKGDEVLGDDEEDVVEVLE